MYTRQGYYSTIGELDRTKLGAINGVVDVTDFTPDDGTDEDEANLAMRAYFKDLISKILRESVDSDGCLLYTSGSVCFCCGKRNKVWHYGV